jgi:FKBP-type peptidyl-prolyl cis-trans isomerase
MKTRLISIAGLLCLSFSVAWSQVNEAERIDEYIKSNHPDASPLLNGMYHISVGKGDGKAIASGDKVTVHYEGWFLDKTVFDSSFKRKKPIVFTLGTGRVIPGWEVAISRMSKGEEAIIVLPSFLAYGNKRVGRIEPNTPLVFRIKLVDVHRE